MEDINTRRRIFLLFLNWFYLFVNLFVCFVGLLHAFLTIGRAGIKGNVNLFRLSVEKINRLLNNTLGNLGK